jgi:hypothetical protein
MIRRRDHGDFLLIAQHDHALLAGELAEHFGNDRFASPIPLGPTILGISLHDCGWPMHDDNPTLNKSGLPLDVFESPRSIAIPAWTASVERAKAKDPYAGLLVSLHVLRLSVFAAEAAKAGPFNMEDPQDRFAIVKFQQRELEHQQKLRTALGLRSDQTGHKPTREVTQKAEDQLEFNIRLLQAMDELSLGLCCDQPLSPQTRDIFDRPGGTSLNLKIARQENDLLVSPWPFSQNEIEVKIPACRVPGRAYKDEAEFRAALATASAEVLTCRVRPA